MNDNYMKDALNELEDIDDYDWEDPDYAPPTPQEEAFADDIYNLLMELVNEDSLQTVTEEFTSPGGLKTHFERHCLAKSEEKVSTRTSVYYDFKDKSQYKELEKELISSANKPQTISVSSLVDVAAVNKSFRKLFEGNKFIYFGTLCQLHNKQGNVSLLIHAFASDYTRNYKQGNTVDVLVIGSGGKTITLYPVDAYYLETKFNNIIKNHSDLNIEFHFNH